MYYKITDKESKGFKRCKELVDKINSINHENEKKLEEFIGFKFDSLWTSTGLNITDDIHGIKPIEGTVPDDNWKQDKDVKGKCWIPNRKKKRGREIFDFIRCKLKGLGYFNITEAVGIKDRLYGRFTIPQIWGDDDIVLLSLDDRHEPKMEGLVEITRSELLKLHKELK
jgi:hypothetical protein